ncbi:DUF3631 domain-containing protein [Amycolatopsis bartoniae]|uniref:DUF3631 domain-containing protein n=1 Tax=Amycolatopsis bartoniae TaxID=941986 RepID=A0A8H9IWA7_9PSEU|nr:DUF3631 domain-containing protein [Amycolatopsis bartoniae]TVT02560.1 DUF3631 domain-containing protein [Amycolatopsis bartoniae]GHF74247.1 hypothetical protein GCM10017566_55040 [Amycolatopsis bartoniae]
MPVPADTTTNTLAAIDDAIGAGVAGGPATCCQCGRPLGESPSDDFCSENCQQVWRSANRVVMAGHEVLDRVRDFVARFNVFPSEHCAPMLALWYAHTHAADHFYVTPRLILSSVEPGSGKTRVLEVAQFLVRAPEMTFSATTAALFRMVSEGPITILFDEVDTIFTAKGGNNEDLRGLLNAGYKRGATVARCVGDAKAMKVQRFPVFAPAALAGIAGNMPDTVTTRAITVHMKRRRQDEEVEEFWEEEVEAEAAPLRDALAAWVESVMDKISRGRPAMPPGVRDRSAEIWRPLIAIADAAGGHWPDTARAACAHFVEVSNADRNGGGQRLQLLADLRDLYTARDTDKLTTDEILGALHQLDESPWGDLDGKPLDPRRLAGFLKPYGVRARDIKLPGGGVRKGYRTTGPDGLADAWQRYLPPAATSARSATPQVRAVAEAGEVADTSATSGASPPLTDRR